MHNNGASEVIVIGGGIGGLTLALALHRAGIKCRVYESSAEIKPLGVGLNLLPHALHALGELGLEAALLAKGIETREYCFYTRHGQLVYREPRGRFAGYSAPQISIHRADLHGALLDAVTERLGADAIRLNHRCVDLEQTEETVTVHFVNAKGEAQAPRMARSPSPVTACIRWHGRSIIPMRPNRATKAPRNIAGSPAGSRSSPAQA